MGQHENFKDEHYRILSTHPVAAVLVADEPQRAVSACRALTEGGVRAVEIALRTPRALECMEAVVHEVPEIFVVAGTVLTPQQVQMVAAAGCAAAVAPGCNPATVRAALEAGLSFAPGVCTPSDIEVALGLNCTLLKFFPAEPAGGLAMLRSMAGPYAHLGLQFIPLGGLRAEHLADYLADPLIAAIGGSWLSPSEVVARGDWDEIRRRAAAATAAVATVRGGDQTGRSTQEVR